MRIILRMLLKLLDRHFTCSWLSFMSFVTKTSYILSRPLPSNNTWAVWKKFFHCLTKPVLCQNHGPSLFVIRKRLSFFWTVNVITQNVTVEPEFFSRVWKTKTKCYVIDLKSSWVCAVQFSILFSALPSQLSTFSGILPLPRQPKTPQVFYFVFLKVYLDYLTKEYTLGNLFL